MGTTEHETYANPSHESTLDGANSAGSDQQYGDLEAAKAVGAREHSTSGSSWKSRVVNHLKQEIDADKCSLQLSFFCLITGWLDGISFAAAFIFAGFQTGNTVQLAAGIARLFSGPDRGSTFHLADRLAITSLVSFACGAFLGRIGDRIGSKTRLWVMGATALQAGFLMAAYVALTLADAGSYATDRGDLAWYTPRAYVALGFMSASLGMQGIVGKRLNTHYGTTVVLTTTWCELVADPNLFRLRPIPSRDHRISSIAFLFVGALASRIILGETSGEVALGIAAGIKFLVAISFWWVPNKGNKSQKPGGL